MDGTDETVTEDYPFDTKRMKPLLGRAREGRANPKGIPYLYLATHRDTAVAEVRPWKGGAVSVGQFKIMRDLKLVNTTIEIGDWTGLRRLPEVSISASGGGKRCQPLIIHDLGH